MTLIELLNAQAAATPDAPAVRYRDTVLTYAELDRAASRLAGWLAARGAGPERIVAVAVPRSAELVVSLVAVLKTGAAYLPIDPDYPAERVAFMREDARPVLTLTGDEPHAAAGSACVPVSGVHVDPRAPAYVIYTSGSTGRPKGVIVSHEAIVNRLLWMQAEYGLTADDRVLQKTPSSFDVSVWEFFWPLITGATLVVAEPGGHRDAAYLADLIQRERITTVHFVPSMLRAFLAEPGAAGCTSLRRVVCSGEALPADLAASFHRILGDRLHNLYGPTEAAVDVTHWACRPGEPGPVPIGRPVWNTAVYVLDRDLRRTPPGEIGELYLAGVQLARGYLRRPALTAERFVPDPYGPPGTRMYRTGDLARMRPDGVVEFAGRADDQIKIRGFRVEPGEIEAVLASHPAVRAAAVAAREDRPGAVRLVAYVVPEGPGDAGGVAPDTLAGWAAARLPAHMVPADYVVLPRLPLTASGKLDRRALPAPAPPAAGATGPAGRAEAGTDAAERTLAELFAEVLALPAVGLDDDFFALGGDSILALHLVGRARWAGLAIGAPDVFEHGTVRALAAVARAAGDGGERGGGADDAAGAVPATPMALRLQERGGVLDRFSQAVTVRLPAGVTEERLLAALRTLLDHHDMLRARLVPEPEADGGPRATPASGEALRGAAADEPGRRPLRLVVPPPGSVDARSVLRRVACPPPPADADPRAASVPEESAAARARLSPADGVMLQAVWFDPGPGGRGLLHLVVHHLVVDTVSWRVIAADLAQAYGGAVPPGRSTPFRSWARALRARDVRAELPYWTSVLSGGDAPIARTPSRAASAETGAETDAGAAGSAAARSAARAGGGEGGYGPARRLIRTLPPEPARRLPFGAAAGDVLLTALAVAVARWRGDGTAVLVDLEGHGRDDHDVDLSRTVGWFTAVYPVRLDPGPVAWEEVVAGGPAAATALRRIAEQTAAVPGKGAGYGLLRYLDPVAGPALARLPRPAICFNHLGRFAVTDADWTLLAEPGSFLDSLDPGLPPDHALTVDALVRDTPAGPYLDVAWTWDARVLDGRRIAELAGLWEAALGGLAAAARTAPADATSTLVPLDRDELREFEEMFS
ncbi:non-ribosomal peptide synthetase [Thermostaphylospora chromogena]|uniref:Non-ribosomal peptide synthase domain TIGR01720/amino acid adenylation domain-containing protein n=1 Tax=Thermostaphylospora chromogena TaxID=35622 RepID=A0A1H1HPP3_9ACTN|nr:non-ribosomal peptide synthetase [Thermostaphylospora chromogena]SDR27363.1 non-ribosomal peptide synthase domain TIGR01720/amino acid adenylation domain-containing protein [Thermostaphylospora chromogena]